MKKHWWVWLTLAGVVIFILYKTFGLSLSKCLTLGTSQKTIAPTAPASAATTFVCGFTCTINPLNSPCLCGGCNYV